MKSYAQRTSGILLSLLLSYIAYRLGKCFPVIGGAVFGLVIGMIAALWKRPEYFEPGIRFTSKKILQYSIILFGFELNMASVLKVAPSPFG